MIVYDGTCGFCTAGARRLRTMLRIPLPVVAAQEIHDLAELGLTPADIAAGPWYIDPFGRRHRGASAIRHALAQCRGAWPLVAALAAVPPGSWLAGAAQTVVSRLRRLLPGAPAALAPSAPVWFSPTTR